MTKELSASWYPREKYEKIIFRGEEEIHRLQESNRRLEQDVDVLKAAAGEEAAYRNRLRDERDAERKRYDILLCSARHECEAYSLGNEVRPETPELIIRPGEVLEIVKPHPDLELLGEFREVKAYKNGLIPEGYIAMTDGHKTVLVRVATEDTRPSEEWGSHPEEE